MMKNKIVIALAIGILAAIGLSVYSIISKPKIAYIRSAVIVDNYLGMKDAMKIYESKASVWQNNVDTLKYDYQLAVSRYNNSYATLTSSRKQEEEQKLYTQGKNLEKYMQSLEEKSQEEKDKIIQGALNQVNSYIEQYSEKEGYDVVLGVTASGNILYGKDAIDITDEVLKGLNQSYKR